VRSEDPESSGEEEPTVVRETEETFALKRTALDPRHRPVLRRLRESTIEPGTPKLNDLVQLLGALRGQRLAELATESEETLQSINPNAVREAHARDEREEAAAAAAARRRNKREASPPSVTAPSLSGGSASASVRRWPWILGGMLLGAAILAAGAGLATLGTGMALSDRLTLDLEVEPASARLVTTDGAFPARGTLTLPCHGPTTVALEAPGHVSERYELRCGVQAVIRMRLSPEP
jgi:hypothetical protein